MPDEIVQPGVASTGAASTTVEAPKAAPTEDLASVKAQIEALTKQITELKISSTREIQSAKDRALAELKKSKSAESALTAIRNRVVSTNPDLAKDVELEMLRAEAQRVRDLEGTSEAAQRQEAFRAKFKADLEEALADMGLDPKDSKIDWAEDAEDYSAAQKRILKSAAKIKKEQEVASKAELQKQAEVQLKETVAKLRKELGLDSVDTSLGGAGASDDAALIKKVDSGEPLTKEERARARKILHI